MSRPTTAAPLNRRTFLLGALAAAGAIGLEGCSSGSVLSGLGTSRAAPRSVEYWDLFGGGDGVRMQQMLDTFSKEHPDIGLTHVTLQWGNPYYTKLSLATIGDKPPGVAVSHLTRMRTLVSSGLLQELRQEDLARHGMSADQFNERAWQTALVDGKTYGIPLDTHPFVTFYNTDVCKKAGLLDADGRLEPLNSEDAFVDAMQRAKKVTGAWGGVVSINNDTATTWRLFQSLYSQLGGQVIADEGRRVVIDDAKAMKVLGLLDRLRANGLLPPSIDYQGGTAVFAGGQSGFYFQGEWEITTYQTAKTPFSMTLFPNVYGGDHYTVQADSHMLVLPKQPSRNQGLLDRSLVFVRALLDQSKVWSEGGHIPAWLPFRDSPEYKKLTPQSSYASAADAAVYDPPGWYSGSGSNFEIITGSAVGSVMAGQAAPEAALKQMRAGLDQLASTASPI